MNFKFYRSKVCVGLILVYTFSHSAVHGQKQLEIQGDPNSVDTVAVFRVNSNAFGFDVVALSAISEPTIGRGIGAYFYGGWNGIVGEGRSSSGVVGKSNSGVGVYGTSEGSAGGFFKGGGVGRDIILGGSSYNNGNGADEGVISTQPSLPSSDLWLVSNDAVVIKLDNNDDEDGHLEIKNGGDSTVVTIDETGNVNVSGEIRSFSTGNANLVPVCYGNIEFSGLINTGTGNFTVSRPAIGNYRISITGHTINNTDYFVLITSKSTFNTRHEWAPLTGVLSIICRDDAGVPKDADFCFQVFRP